MQNVIALLALISLALILIFIIESLSNILLHLYYSNIPGENCPTNFHVIQKKVQIKQQKETPKISIGSNVTVIEGSALLLKCPVSMYGRCDVTWKKDDSIVNRMSWRRYLFSLLDCYILIPSFTGPATTNCLRMQFE